MYPITHLQIQRTPLKIDVGDGKVYDPAPLTQVSTLRVDAQGVIGMLEDGAALVDAHHPLHPQTRFREYGNGVSIGFSAHYHDIRKKFGDTLGMGQAGENIIVDAPHAFWLDDLAKGLAVQRRDGSVVRFRVVKPMAPCDPFSHFVNAATERLPTERLKETLQFLDNGRRGFIIAPESPIPIEIRVGDLVIFGE